MQHLHFCGDWLGISLILDTTLKISIQLLFLSFYVVLTLHTYLNKITDMYTRKTVCYTLQSHWRLIALYVVDSSVASRHCFKLEWFGCLIDAIHRGIVNKAR